MKRVEKVRATSKLIDGKDRMITNSQSKGRHERRGKGT